ncbi:hypothetical protein KX928_23260 [Roseobacter sp. YSTF-M11]|uniref:Uncharacterized protein n=1 Tax=Roseobacter insulae TaxID=2859783 RepID=A0A9X1G0K7_9RHOB|nr:hypothetical protein [Roseobacter insulae]MBW4710719.1 hypothetical protein [Roseobacter insulae]
MTKWGPLIDHTGGDCPLEPGTYLRVYSDVGDISEGVLQERYAQGWNWSLPPDPDFGHVLCYQLRSENHLNDVVAMIRDVEPVAI